MELRKKLLDLEILSRMLEPSGIKRSEVRKEVLDYTENFLESISNRKSFDPDTDLGKELLSLLPGEDPVGISKLVEILKKNVDEVGLNPASGGHLGYIPGGGIYFSALGDYMADVFNRYAGIFYAGPGAVRMENLLIRWMAQITGYPSGTVGNLTTGGSLANLMGIVTARDAMGIKSADIPKAVIYLSEQAHHSIQKAIRISGMNECILRFVKLDAGFRIVPDDLKKQIHQDRLAGLLPFLVVASAGTTDVGAVDPLEEIGSICKDEKLWYHIDAAYGGFFVLTENGKKKLKGMEWSDSLAIDPHKGLFLPYGLGVILVKEPKHLNASHHYVANYMQDAQSATGEVSPADLSPELTKHFRGLRLWLPLLLHGLKPFRACLEEKLLLTRYFHEEVKKLGFETGPEPELSVATYRFVPKTGDADAFNLKLQEKVVRDGRVFITSTRLHGKVWLRFACLSFRTHLNTVDTLLEVLGKETKGIS